MKPQRSYADPPLPRLSSIDNFRDLAGTFGGYPVTDGRMRLRTTYRSNRIEPTAPDVEFLNTLGLVAIHDLREPHEIERHPDVAIDGAEWRHHCVPGIPVDVIASLSTPEETYSAMVENYRTFVSDPECRAGLAGFLTSLAETDGPQLFHCAAGKDRTGWAAALLQHIAGVDSDIINADYLLTDEYSVESRKATLDAVLTVSGSTRAPALEPAFRSDLAYLRIAFDEATKKYGDMDRYLSQGLGLTPATISKLRDRLVVNAQEDN